MAHVDDEGFVLLDMEILGQLGESEDNAIILKFGKPQASTVQRLCGLHGVSEAFHAVPFRLRDRLEQAFPHLSVAAASSLAAEEGLLIHPCRLVGKRRSTAQDNLQALLDCVDRCRRRCGGTCGLEARQRSAVRAEVSQCL